MSTLTPPDILRPTMEELLLPTGHPDHPARYSPTGLTVERRNTVAGLSPFDTVEWEKRDWAIKDSGKIVAEGVYEAPAPMSEVACNTAASKYARKTQVPQYNETTGEVIREDDGSPVLGRETSFKQTTARIANAFMFWGQSGGYFASAEDALAFRDEMLYLLIHQRAANNSPVWFNVGTYEAYGIVENGEGNVYFDPEAGEVVASPHKYFRAAVNACYILQAHDTLVDSAVGSETGKSIFGTMMNEARLFKAGSGAGANWSAIRAKGEPLTGGGTSSGVISFLKVIDAAAGSIKSGGTTRRAAKMVVLDADHPEVETYIQLKVREEEKIPFLEAAGYSLDWRDQDNGAYAQVNFQNANHTVSLPAGFMQAVAEDGDWDLVARKATDDDGKPLVMKTIKARQLYDDIAQAAWRCADPGLHHNDIMNDWHTAPNDGPIRGSNPCSEYLFLDDTACNLASLRLTGWWDPQTGFDADGFVHASRLFTIGLEIAVHMSHYPSAEVARKSHQHRTLGLGICDIGGLLMRSAIPYDSDKGRAVSASIQALQTSVAYAASAEMAAAIGPCEGFGRNREPMLRVLSNHRRAAHGSRAPETGAAGFSGLSVLPQVIDHANLDDTPFSGLSDMVLEASDAMVAKVTEHGARNMQTTVTAPTGTIGILMGADTTGPEPHYSFLTYKKLDGGGTAIFVNVGVSAALAYLGYTPAQVKDVETHIIGTRTVYGNGPINNNTLAGKGVPQSVINAIDEQVKASLDLRMATGMWMLDSPEGREFAAAKGITGASGSFIDELFDPATVDAASKLICGHLNITHAPHIDPDHLPIFEVADAGGEDGRSLSWSGHVKMLGATAPFLSGAASKTINLPADATVDDIRDAHLLCYEQGVKAVAVYRDGSKMSQPLSSQAKKALSGESDEAEQVDPYAAVAEAIRSGQAPIGRVDELRELLDIGVAAASDTMSADEFANALDAKDKHALRELIAQLGEIPEGMSPAGFYDGKAPRKFRMPAVRSSVTEKFRIGDQDVFLTHGAYPDGTCGEFFLKLSKEGGTTEGLVSMLATVASMALQRGVPLEEIVNKFLGQRFEPAGMVVGHPNVKMAASILDAVGRILAFRYLHKEAGDRWAKIVHVAEDPFVAVPTAWQPGLTLDLGADKDALPAASVPVSVVESVQQAQPVLPLDGDAPEAGSLQMGGKYCHSCGDYAMFPNGACDVCRSCSATSGCS